jgi:hypothetical protein
VNRLLQCEEKTKGLHGVNTTPGITVFSIRAFTLGRDVYTRSRRFYLAADKDTIKSRIAIKRRLA